MSLLEGLLDWIHKNPFFIAIGLTSILQISPIKINPWTSVLYWIGGVFNKPVMAELENVKQDIQNVKSSVTEIKKINDRRWSERVRGEILEYARACQCGQLHTRSEWEQKIALIEEYDNYVKENELVNGKFVAAKEYLQETYQRRLKKNDFLDDKELYKN